MMQPTKFALEVRTTDFILRPTDDDGEVASLRLRLSARAGLIAISRRTFGAR